jgi:hypothetical protein
MEDVDSLLVLDEEDKDPKSKFRTLILNLVDLVDKNFEYVNIIIYEREKIPNSVSKIFVSHLAKYLEKILPERELDYTMLAFMILSFLYFITLNKKREETFLDLDQAIEEFISYHSNSLGL